LSIFSLIFIMVSNCSSFSQGLVYFFNRYCQFLIYRPNLVPNLSIFCPDYIDFLNLNSSIIQLTSKFFRISDVFLFEIGRFLNRKSIFQFKIQIWFRLFWFINRYWHIFLRNVQFFSLTSQFYLVLVDFLPVIDWFFEDWFISELTDIVLRIN